MLLKNVNPNLFGLYDMIMVFGLEFYEVNPEEENPCNNNHGEKHVLRGGSYMRKPEDLRITCRNETYSRGSRGNNFLDGFRLAMNCEIES